MRALLPIVGPALIAQHRQLNLYLTSEHQNWQLCNWCPVLLTDESRFTLSTCDKCEICWRHHAGCYAACNIIEHDWFGSGSVVSLGGTFLQGDRDLSVLANIIMTAARYQDEILRLIVRPYAGEVGLGSSWCRTMTDLMEPECINSSWATKALTPLTVLYSPQT